MRLRTLAPALAAMALAGTAGAKVYELPRSTSTMPVQALITCETTECEVAEHCARYDKWANIASDVDFSKEWTFELGQAVMTPKRASANLMCAVSIRKGQTYIRALRYLRHRDETGNWVYDSMTRDWGFREMDLEVTRVQAPATDYDFYQLVKGRRLCFDGCGESDEYIYFGATLIGSEVWSGDFTHFVPSEGTLKGDWEYERSTETSGSLTLIYGGIFDTDFTCWLTLEFETNESGTYSATCDAEEALDDEDGEWIVTGR